MLELFSFDAKCSEKIRKKKLVESYCENFLIKLFMDADAIGKNQVCSNEKTFAQLSLDTEC